MKIWHEIKDISGAFLIDVFYAKDVRGNFLKSLQSSKVPDTVDMQNIAETYISSSQKNVLRGMHYQRPPYDLQKLVTVISGRVLDVILDMRKNSPTFGKAYSTELGDGCPFRSLFVPSGCAHGFLSLCDHSQMLYHTTAEFNSEYDTGVRYDSIGFNWQIEEKELIMTERDRSFRKWVPADTEFV